MSFRKTGALLLIIASWLSFPIASCSQSIDDSLSCPTGFFVWNYFIYGPTEPSECRADPCYGNPGPCGAGNQCRLKVYSISGRTTFENVCTCTAPSVLSHRIYEDFCYVPGTDRCNPSPCKNGGTCFALADFNGVNGAFGCACPSNFQGSTCELPNPAPNPTPKNGTPQPTPPPTPPPTTGPITGDQGLCGKQGDAAAFPQRCWFNTDPRGRYVCCDAQGCDGFNADNLTPHCKNFGYVPPNFGENGGPPPPPTGDQGVCGKTGAEPFPNRCWFNNDPLGRYVCCDNQGCDGFNADNLTPRCKNFGYVPPNQVLPPGPTPTSGGPQGVCGSGSASAFPIRCWYNNDPQGRYVCCDNDGCDGFNPPDNFFPRCKSNGFVPPNL